MPATRTEARDQVMEVVRTAAIAAGIAASDVIYDAKERRVPESSAVRPWCRVSLKHQDGSKRSLTGNHGRSRFVRNALLTVQLFVKSGDGLAASDAAVPYFTSRMEGQSTPGGVEFLDVTANEIGEDGPWYNTNIFARIEYDEFVST